MKVVILIAFVISLASCNTAIGVWRDTKATYNWSKKKIQESQNGGEVADDEYEQGAPVY